MKVLMVSHRANLRLFDEDKLVFGASVYLQDATAFRRLMHQAERKGQTGFTFDFRATTYASPLAMAQLVTSTESSRNSGMHFDVLEPKDRSMRRLFALSNWAHHLSPVNYPPTDRFPAGWLPVVRYRNSDELLRFVEHTCSVMLREADLRRPALHGLEWALYEIADNVFQHANAPNGGLAAVTVGGKRRRVQFVVADAGRGIPASLTTGHPGIKSDVHALREAIKQGVTRDRTIGAGNGLAGALRISIAAQGRFSVFSGRGMLVADHESPLPRGRTWSENSSLDGSVLHFEMAVNRDFDLERALLEDGITISEWDFLEATYAPDESDMRIRVSEEVSTTGTRTAAEPLRRKITNLVRAHPSARVIVDFAGIERVTASFADEVIGKPLVSLGAARFSERVAIEGVTDDLVRGQIKRALSQRAEESRKRPREKLMSKTSRGRRPKGRKRR